MPSQRPARPGPLVERRRSTDAAGIRTRVALSPRAWLLFLAICGLAIAVYEVIPAGVVDDLAYSAISVASVVAIIVGVHAYQPAHRSIWYLIAAGLGLWVVGDLVFSWSNDVAHSDAFPTPADAFYLCGYLVLFAGLGQLIRVHRDGRERAQLIDSGIVTVGLGLLSWVILTGPTISGQHDSALAAVVSVSYPVADIVLVGLLVHMATALRDHVNALRMLMIAMLLLVVGDITSSALGLYTSADTRSFDYIWLVSYVMCGAAALHPSMHVLTAPDAEAPRYFGRGRLLAMALATTIAPATLAVERLAGYPLTVWPVVVGCVVMFLLVVYRMSLNIRQIITANQQRESLREELIYQAAHDSLTRLPNRAQAMRLLTGALHRAQRSGAIIAVLFVDLDGFKAVNDTFGHQAGDEVLQKVAETLLAEVRAGDVVARLGGDEFVVILEPIDTQASALTVADRLVASLSAPIQISGPREAHIGASIGLAISQDGRVDPDALLHEADIAVYRAKGSGRGRTEVFSASLRAELAARAELELDIAQSIRNDEFELHYQPVMEVATGKVDGYEALVRWNRGGRGLMPPNEFIEVAETSDLICEVDTWVLRRGLRQLAHWSSRPGMERLNLGINISGRHVARARIIDDVRSALAEFGIEAGRLILEVTETVLIDEPVASMHMEQLRRHGVLISIDDFGTGYNSITRLETLPADVVKIDKRFVDTDSTSSKLLPLMIQSAHAFGLPVVAEGVESDEQLDRLRALDCELAQGFHIARPMDAEQVERWHLGRRAARV